MSFLRYPKYKDSGVAWLGEVPEHWEVGPVKRHILKVESGTSVNAADEPAENGKLGVLKTSCVYTGVFRPDENKTVVEDDLARVSCPLKAGTIIVSRMNTPELIGAAGLVETAPGNLFLPDRLWQISFANSDVRFVHFWTRTSLYRAQVESICTGTSASMKNLAQDQFGMFSFASPPIDEQRHIAEFLDRETGKIDELVAEQQRLMELLKEKRQAVISHAVTKGLNPRAPMKPSGIEWLGDVPTHWNVKPLKRLMVESVAGPYGGSLTKDMYTTSGYRVYGQQQVISNDFAVGDYFISKEKYEEMRRYTVHAGDVLVTVMGTIGKVSVVPDDAEPGIINPRLVRYRCDAGAAPEFIRIVLMSQKQQETLLFEANGTTMDGLNMQILGKIPIPLPPHEEQLRIVDYVGNRTAEFDTLAAEAQKAIDLLQERRTALISAAVTGQIDVRKLAAA